MIQEGAYKEIKALGRITFDLLVMLGRYKLKSYKLNYAAYHFLKEQKDDVHHTMIPVLQHGTSKDRRILAEYCLKDCLLPLRLMAKLKLLIVLVEECRVTGPTFHTYCNSGKTVPILCAVMREMFENSRIVPDLYFEKEPYMGATVISPHRDFYQEPVSTLDFQALYPSIIIAFNLCYTTAIRNFADMPSWWEEGIHYRKVPIKEKTYYFVTRKVIEGVLPRMMQKVLKKRYAKKGEMKNAKTQDEKEQLDSTQLALKLIANATYGLTTVPHAKMLLYQIGEAITAYGRYLLLETRHFMQNVFTFEPRHYTGFAGLTRKCDFLQPPVSKIVYGDTDSVMLIFQHVDVDDPKCTVCNCEACATCDECSGVCNCYHCTGTCSCASREECLGRLAKKIPGTNRIHKYMGIQRIIRISKEAEAASSEYLTRKCILIRGETYKHRLINLEFEKVYYPYLLMTKKRYLGIFWDHPYHPDKVDGKGIEFVRRDFPQIVGKTLKRVLTLLCEDQDKKGALQHLQSVVQRIYDRKVDIEEVVISKSLKEDVYAYKARQSHTEMIKRRLEEEPDFVYYISQRFPYVFRQPHGDGKKEGATDLSVDPMEVAKGRYQLYTQKYVDMVLRTCLKPLVIAFATRQEIEDAWVDPNNEKRYKQVTARIRKMVMKGVRKPPPSVITTTPVRQVPHKRKITEFFSRVETHICALCKRVRSPKKVCRNCAHQRKNQVALEKEWKQWKGESERLWDICRKCQGPDRFGKIECAATDCNQFYSRHYVRHKANMTHTLLKDIEDLITPATQ